MNIRVASLPTTVAGAPQSDTVLQLGQLPKLLRQHVWLILSCAVLAMAAAYLYARTLPKTYTASSILAVEGDRFAIPELQGALRGDTGSDPMPFVRTEVQALTSRALVAEVAAKLHLDANPEFNPALRPPTLVQQAKDMISQLLAKVLPRPSADAPAAGPDEAVVASVFNALAVFQDNRSLVISLSFTAQDPRLAADFVNILMDSYVQARARRRVDANQGANNVMVERIDQVRADLTAIEQRMRDLRSKSDVVALRAGSVGQQQVEELTTAAARATLERSQLEVNYERAQAAAKQGSSDALAAVLTSPTISRMRDQEAQASRRMAELSSRYGPDYPGIRSAGAELASARRQIAQEASRIVDSLGAQLRVARAQETDVLQQLDKARHVGVQAENARAELDQLQQEATTRRNLYQTLLERAQQTVAQPAASATPDVRVLSPAVAPGKPSGPNMKLAALLGGSGGALLGCLLALTRVSSVRGFETAEELTRVTGLVVLATLPRRLVRRGHGLLATRTSNAALEGSDVEALRALRERLRFSGRTGVPRCALFLPAVADVAPFAAPLTAGMARVAAADGEQVLLVETDLQRPSLGNELGLMQARRDDATRTSTSQNVGLPAVLAGADWRDMVVSDRQVGLDLLLAGGRMADTLALLSGVHFQNLLVEARADYDLVLLYAATASTELGGTGQTRRRRDPGDRCADRSGGDAGSSGAAGPRRAHAALRRAADTGLTGLWRDRGISRVGQAFC